MPRFNRSASSDTPCTVDQPSFPTITIHARSLTFPPLRTQADEAAHNLRQREQELASCQALLAEHRAEQQQRAVAVGRWATRPASVAASAAAAANLKVVIKAVKAWGVVCTGRAEEMCSRSFPHHPTG